MALVFGDGPGVADGFEGVVGDGFGFVQPQAFFVGCGGGFEAELGIGGFVVGDALEAVVRGFVGAEDGRGEVLELHFRHDCFRYWIEHGMWRHDEMLQLEGMPRNMPLDIERSKIR